MSTLKLSNSQCGQKLGANLGEENLRMYRRHVILNPRYKFESNIMENNVYRTNICSSISFLKIAMIAKPALL